MTTRCGCKDEGDEIVFGPCRVCPPTIQTDGCDIPVNRSYSAAERPWETTLGEDETHG